MVVAIAMIAWLTGITSSEASFFSFPRMLKLQFQSDRMTFGAPVLAPMAYIRFCLRYQNDCKVHHVDFDGRPIALTLQSWNELNTTNRQVNHDIIPQLHASDATHDQWYISPRAGDCADYAVTKRHELLSRGWPSQSLLLAEVVVPSGEHHLVLVVRTQNADLVLDNLNENIRTVAMTRPQYQWIRVESPVNPMFWSAVNISPPGPKTVPIKLRTVGDILMAGDLPPAG